jgi:hypothetical protein
VVFVAFSYRELLMSFRRATGQKPQRIIFYRYCNVFMLLLSRYFFLLSNEVYIICRDGVSEGQFYQVLLYELDAIRKVGIISISVFCPPPNLCVEVGIYWGRTCPSYLFSIFLGMCLFGAKLSASGDFCCGSEASSHEIVCRQPS